MKITPFSGALVVVLTLQQAALVLSFTYQQSGYWETEGCTGAPFYVDIFPEFNCGQRNITYNCSPYTFNGTEYYRTVICVEDTQMWTWSYYQSTPYVLMEQYRTDTECSEYFQGRVVIATGNCVKMINSTSYQSAIATMEYSGSESLQFFMDNECAATPSTNLTIESAIVANHSCYNGEYKFYSQIEYTSTDEGSGSSSSGDTSTNSTGSSGSYEAGINSNSGETSIKSADSSALSTGAYAGIVVAALAFVVCVAWLIYWWGCRSTTEKQESTAVTDQNGVDSYEMENSPKHDFISEASGDGAILWRDEAILGARVPREKVIIKRRIARGGYGEVYNGTYNETHVAVKMLLPETRKSKAHRIAFLAEVKLMATLDHPHIVRLVGVAWDSPNDLCALTELMDGGDLRSLLNKYDMENRPTGFTYEKVKIALHIAHALAYIHSLAPPLIHRDLKPRNVLLTSKLDAKLADFGVAREHIDRTMTAEVGTSLWMAPEVLMGQRYDHKADIFSFGVMLAELNTHAMPYSHARFQDGSSDRLPDTAILQLVVTGKLHADFSQGGPDVLMRLGLECVGVDPGVRPSTPEVLYRLHKIMQEISN
ncbi:hypothetical protein V7S43_008989 [Phytophthora oleae]|uniref:Protein kinase domain-containing protein n=1 Tax=Phytophthora oleae TaxID=2107226 RepID=A0ABD3FIE9_9STRA